MKRLEINCTIPVKFFKEQGVWVARAPQLRLSANGDTKGEALDNLDEIVREFFLFCVGRGNLLDVLAERSVEHKASTHRHESSKMITVPIPLMAQYARRQMG